MFSNNVVEYTNGKMNLKEQIELVDRMIRINKDYRIKDFLAVLKSIRAKELPLSSWKEKAVVNQTTANFINL